MGDRIYADLAVLEQGVQDMERALRAYEDVLSELDDHLRSSLERWDGDARKAYDSFHRQWRRQAHDVALRLGWLRQVIANSHGNYHRSRSANLQMWNP
jgi:uncharacterized protein YukE